MAIFTRASERRRLRRSSSSDTPYGTNLPGNYGGGFDGNYEGTGFGEGENPDDYGEGGGGIAATPIRNGPFPEFPTVDFPEIETAPYQKTDVVEFAKRFGEFNRGELNRNFEQAQDFSLKALDTELKGLKAFAPAAAALARRESSVDNQVNQARRSAQVDATLPTARDTFSNIGRTLRSQAKRAERYASGRLQSGIEDAALELNIRSRAADMSNASGVGPRSETAAKTSNLMSAETRFGISQYGESLTGQNVGQQEQLIREEAQLLLAPTVYNDLGNQIKPTPEVGAGRLTYQGYGAANEATLVSPGQALQSEIQQEQFGTTLEQRTREFNATGKFSAETFNANGIFQSRVGQFQSDAAYNSAVTAANQAELNFAAALELQSLQQDGYNVGVSQAQSAQQTQATGQAIGATAAAVGGIVDILSPDTATVSSGSPVGGTDVDTTPSTSSSSPNTNLETTDAGDLDFGYSGESTPAGGTIDGSSPSTYKLAPGSAIPSGFSPVAQDARGGTSVVRAADYGADLERFAKFTGGGGESISLPSAVSVDRAISSASGLAYVPIQGFQAVATSNSGRQIYSEPGVAASGNVGLGGGKVEAAVLAAATLGVSDPAMLEAMIQTGNTAVNTKLQGELDTLYSSGGDVAVGQKLLQSLGGESVDTTTESGKKLAFGAMRIGELWPNLSPAQRSLAISSLAPTAVEARTGKSVASEVIPGTKDSVSGPLTVGDAISVTGSGKNGFALARNWTQLSALGSLLGATKPGAVAAISDTAGFLGFGPQGAAVNIPPDYIERVGAKPAPEMGIGAAVFGTAAQVPRDYELISAVPGGVLALPKNLKGTSTVNSTAPQPLAFRKASEIASGVHPAQKRWGKKPSVALRGSAGGSAIISGMSTLVDANPALAGSLTAYALFNNSMG